MFPLSSPSSCTSGAANEAIVAPTRQPRVREPSPVPRPRHPANDEAVEDDEDDDYEDDDYEDDDDGEDWEITGKVLVGLVVVAAVGVREK